MKSYGTFPGVVSVGMMLITGMIFFMSCTTTSTLYLVRHAEKDLTVLNDPPLTAEGRARALDLSTTLRDKKIVRVFSTPTARTLSTAKPAADSCGLLIRMYSADTLQKFADRISLLPGNSLVVGHSNTIPQTLEAFGLQHSFAPMIPDADYDNLFIVKLRRKGTRVVRKSLTETTYGKISP